jgi:hypothetical protein
VTFTPYKTTTQLLTNNAYGDYGGRANGTARRIKPMLLMCMHITDGAETAANVATHNKGERDYANRAGSGGPSAHDYIARDGNDILAIDPAKFAAWSNGDLKTPNTALPIVQTILAQRAKGYNPNECFYREVEMCGRHETGLDITAAQLETVAQMIAKDSIATGIAISRATVGTHADINTETRSRCAFLPGVRESKLAGVIARAQAIKLEIQAPTMYTQAQYDAAKKASYDEGFAAGKASVETANADALKASYNDGVLAASNAAATAIKS